MSGTGSRKPSRTRASGSSKSNSSTGTTTAHAAPAGATESLRSDVPHAVKISVAAARVRALASGRPAAAWKKVQGELEVQKLVWASVVVARGKSNATLKDEIEAARLAIDEILALRDAEQERALVALEELLCSTSTAQTFSNPMKAAMADVLEQHQLMTVRSLLAERLDVAGIPATLPRNAEDKQEVEELVVSCDLREPKLERAVRKLLLLPVLAEQGSGGLSRLEEPPLWGAAASAVRSAPAGAATRVSKRTSGASDVRLRVLEAI